MNCPDHEEHEKITVQYEDDSFDTEISRCSKIVFVGPRILLQTAPCGDDTVQF
jgi:hypothetical protein